MKQIYDLKHSTQCGNCRIFLTLRFYVKSILAKIEYGKVLFYQFWRPLNFETLNRYIRNVTVLRNIPTFIFVAKKDPIFNDMPGSSSFRGCCCWAICIWKAVRSAFLGGINPNAHSQRNFDPVTSFYGANNWMIMEKYDPSLSADAYFTTTAIELVWVPRSE